MRLKPRDIEINPNLPKYPFDNDLLDRKEEIENLTQIIQNVEDPLVLSINSPWGTGKTTFIKLWCKYLEQQGQKTLYFNAWETDFAEDPLIVLVSKLDKWVTDDGKSENETWNKFKKDIFPRILERSLIAGIKAATFKVVDMDKEYEKIFADLSGEITGDLIDKFNQKSQAITQFKDGIKELLDTLPKQHKNLIIFIDELDRCRPTYAIELLERIKHLFNVERLVFILSTDTEQLSHSICAVYGNNFDAKKYLNRFIDLDYSLKEPDLRKYIQWQFENSLINDYHKKRQYGEQNKKNLLINLIFFFARRFDLKLRDINLLMTRVLLILLSISVSVDIVYEPILVTLLALREQNKQLYDEYIANPETADKLISFLRQNMSENEAISGMEDLKFEFLEVFYEICNFLIICDRRNQKQLYKDLSNFHNLSYFQNSYNMEEFTSMIERTDKISKRFDSSEAIQVIKTTVQYIELFNRINININ